MKTLYFTPNIYNLHKSLISQIYEIGIIGGGTNVIGDVGSNICSAKKISNWRIIRWNRSPRHSYRASVIYTTLFGNDNLGIEK